MHRNGLFLIRDWNRGLFLQSSERFLKGIQLRLKGVHLGLMGKIFERDLLGLGSTKQKPILLFRAKNLFKNRRIGQVLQA
ncbi:hypothetical protein D3C75_1107840 [compost metagenome]